MNVYIVTWPGENAGGFAVVVADDADQARDMALLTDDCGAWRTKDRVEVKQVDPGLRYVAFTNNGFGG